MTDKNIYQRINAVMKDCEYLQKKEAQQGKGIRYDEVMAMIREHLINHGIVMETTQDSMELVGAIEGTKQKLYQGKYTLKLINIDKPEEFCTHTTYAQGMDGGDKGAGKAHTYAMKTMLVKGFGIETGDDEESRSEKQEKLKVISGEEYEQLAVYCVDSSGVNWSKTGAALLKAYNISGIQNLPAAKFTEALKRAKGHADNK